MRPNPRPQVNPIPFLFERFITFPGGYCYHQRMGVELDPVWSVSKPLLLSAMTRGSSSRLSRALELVLIEHPRQGINRMTNGSSITFSRALLLTEPLIGGGPATSRRAISRLQ